MRRFRSTTRAQRLALMVGGLVALGIAAGASAVSFTNASLITINDRATNPPPCGTFSANLSAPITINDGTTPPTPASPYPSAANFVSLGGTLTDVNVKLNGFSHTFPDDVDILLVGPNGATVVLMSDVGGGNPGVSGLTITLDDAAASSLPDGGPLTSGTFKPTNASGSGTETFPAPAPAGPYGSTLAALNGGTPNGKWSLYVVDDQAQDSGSISGGWTLTFTTAGCPPPPPPAPPAAAAPYPSTIGVSGVSGTVSDANVTLNGFSHTHPDDVDALLVGPTGATTILMSDVGGGTDAVNLSITLDDEAASSLPDAGPLVSGSFKPTNFEVDEPFPSPAPAGPYGALTAFDGTNPNGTWSLYVVDDVPGDSGSISGGWTLTLAGPTAVALRSFAAHPGASGVALAWRTASETGIAGFELYRSSPGSKPVRLNRTLIPAKRTGSAQGASYRFLDRSARAGASYTYRLQLVSLSGARSPGGSVSLYAGR